jgi:hypothetical protein
MKNASPLSEVTRGDTSDVEHKTDIASLSIEAFELSRLCGGGTLVVWILNGVLVLEVQFGEGSYTAR